MHGGEQHNPTAIHITDGAPAAGRETDEPAERFRLKSAAKMAMELIAPTDVACLVCGEPSHGEPLCAECRTLLDTELLPEEPNAVWVHRGVPRQLVLRLKFARAYRAADVMAEAIAEKARQLDLPPDTVVTSVTMPFLRKNRRGIDHGRVLAEAVARELGYPYRKLLKRRNRLLEHTQRGLNAQQRSRNLRHLFTGVDCQGLHVLLIDDVTTTGSTGRVCTEALLQAGAASVCVMTAVKA